jgi:hypothetical protein
VIGGMAIRLDYFAPRPAHEMRRSPNITSAWWLLGIPLGLFALAWFLKSGEVAGMAYVTAMATCPLGIIVAIEGLKWERGPRATSALVCNAAGAAAVWCGMLYALAIID